MPHNDRDDYHAGVHTRKQLEAQYGSVYDLVALARQFILVGIDGQHVVVRKKDTGEEGTLRYVKTPLSFFDFRPRPGGLPRPARRGLRT